MRFFRIPSFTGIETHRDDADRGSLRVVEGCLPHGPGGVRSAPVWEEVGTVDMYSSDDTNMITASDDGNGNSLIFNSRNSKVTDIIVMTTENTAFGVFGSCYLVSNSTIHNEETGAFGPIGNRMFAIGDGTHEAVYVGKGPPTGQIDVFPDELIYRLEWSRFPRCKYYVQGPNKTIFAAGNPAQPLTVYISEPAGATNKFVDSPYSTYESASNYEGMLSTVDILGSKAEKITALSSNGNQVIVHTDKGCHVLYAPTSDQASTGFRVEQAPSSVFSGAVSSRVVSSDNGSMIFWLGHDGQIYKDESASRGSEDAKKYTDPEQASWKSKGLWDKNQPDNISSSFAFYCPQSGYYWVFIATEEVVLQLATNPVTGPTNLAASSPLPSTGPINLVASDVPVAPGAPTNLDSNITSFDAPGVPTNLDSNITSFDAPGVPTNLNSTLTLGAPGVPTNLSSSITSVDAPGVPTNLSSNITSVDAPGVPTNLSSSVVFEPGVPTNLNSSITSVDAPGPPTNLNSNLTHDLPGIPTNLVSNLILPNLTTNVVFHGNALNWPQSRRDQYIYAAEKIGRLIRESHTLTIDIVEGLPSPHSNASGGMMALSGPSQIVDNGLKSNYILVTRGTCFVDPQDVTAMDTAVGSFLVNKNGSWVSEARTSHYYVALHEYIHILGFGTLWDPAVTHNSNFNYQSLYSWWGSGAGSPGSWGLWPGGSQYVGSEGLVRYQNQFGTTGLNWQGGSATFHHGVPMQDASVPAHWYLHQGGADGATNIFGGGTGQYTSYKKTAYPGGAYNYQPMANNEIMTPEISMGDPLYISRLTGAVLMDLGYTVDNSQTDYWGPGGSFSSATLREEDTPEQTEIIESLESSENTHCEDSNNSGKFVYKCKCTDGHTPQPIETE